MNAYRKLILAAVLILSPCLAFGQGVAVRDIVLKPLPAGGVTPVSSALITVCTSAGSGLPCTPKVANIYSDEALTTPITGTGGAGTTNSDGNGNFIFFIAPGTYIVTITGSGLSGLSYKITALGGQWNIILQYLKSAKRLYATGDPLEFDDMYFEIFAAGYTARVAEFARFEGVGQWLGRDPRNSQFRGTGLWGKFAGLLNNMVMGEELASGSVIMAPAEELSLW